MASTGSWPSAPKEAFIVGLKELPESKDPVIHGHIFYAHAYKVGPWLFYIELNPSYSNISICVLDTVIYTFPTSKT